MGIIKFSRRAPIVFGLLVVFLWFFINFIFGYVFLWMESYVFMKPFFFGSSFQGIVNGIILISSALGFVLFFKFGYIFFKNSRSKAVYIIVLICVSLYLFFLFLNFFNVFVGKICLRPIWPMFTSAFVLVLASCSEELIFRGIVVNALAKKYAKTKAGVVFCVFFAGLIFGSAHFVNSINCKLSGVLWQCLGTFIGGIFSAAIYLRCRNIWIVMLLHVTNNLVAAFDRVFLGSRGLVEIINSYSSEMLLFSMMVWLFYLGGAWIVLRKNGFNEIICGFKEES